FSSFAPSSAGRAAGRANDRGASISAPAKIIAMLFITVSSILFSKICTFHASPNFHADLIRQQRSRQPAPTPQVSEEEELCGVLPSLPGWDQCPGLSSALCKTSPDTTARK